MPSSTGPGPRSPDASHAYDVIVIGAGAAGLNVAAPAAKLGLKTLLIDKNPENFGGECLLTGCVPSKALLHVAKLCHDGRRLNDFGFRVYGSLDFQKAFEYVRGVKAKIQEHDSPDFLETFGLEFSFGTARFVSPNSVEVGGRRYHARRIVLATGSRPRIPDVLGVQHVRYLTHENLFQIERLPRRFLIVGGGPIGVEMAQAFARLGSQVTLIEQGPRLLARDPEEASGIIQRCLEREGVTVHLNANLQAFPTRSRAAIDAGGRFFEQPFDQVLFAAGKKLDFGELNLTAAGIATANGKIQVDPYLRTSNKQVFVCGDAVGHVYLTHVTELHASVILWNLFSPVKKKLSYDHLSWVTFTDPEVATFGLSERQIKKRGIAYRKVVQGFEDVNRATTDSYPESQLIVYLKGDRLLGGTMVAPNAGELIQELILARQNKLSLRKLLDKVYPYPTAARVNRWLAIWEYDRKMTEPVKKILRGAFQLVSRGK
jgi:pyruvate/2-oxoglutarate dehydrogenase complex dihydrolipoamide dehydrogenase (E3) component